MNFYQVILKNKQQKTNEHLTWYENLFATFVDAVQNMINLTNQMFTYRKIPVHYEGTCTIDKIKGNTVKFNQLADNVSSHYYIRGSGTGFSYDTTNHVITGTLASNTSRLCYDFIQTDNHTYFISANVTSSINTGVFRIEISKGWQSFNSTLVVNTSTKISGLLTATSASDTNNRLQMYINNVTDYSLTIKNLQIHDLTAIFGSGNEPSTTSEFESWLSSHIGNLPYYDYTLGTLIPFNGTGLKTVGKNLCPYKSSSVVDAPFFDVPEGTYICSFKLIGSARYSTSKVSVRNENDQEFGAVSIYNVSVGSVLSFSFTLTEKTSIYIRSTNVIAGEGELFIDDIQVEFGSSATSYEPYTTSTLSLPVSTYFPTGMKSAGKGNSTTYDELTKSKASEKIGTRTYQSGDDYDVRLTTDGTNTNYPLAKDTKIYGIKRELSTSSSAWTRTDDGIGKNANATHDGTDVSNDFDSIYPWSDIITVNLADDGTVNAKLGDSSFKWEGTNGEVMTYVPSFYYKRWQDSTYEYMQISQSEFTGASYSKGFYIGRYTTSSGAHSKSGVSSQVSTTITNFRTQAQAKGTNWQQLDYHFFLLELLYLVEYADYNSQSKLGQGNCSTSSQINSGSLDSLGMKSGCLANAGATAVIYRGIENIFGNIWQFVDGLNIKDNVAYICYKPSSYAVDTFDGDYSAVGYTNATSNGNPKTLGMDNNNPLIALSTSVGGSSTTYMCDYYWQNTGNRIARVGGYWNHGASDGLFYWHLRDNSDYTNTYMGSRLIYNNDNSNLEPYTGIVETSISPSLDLTYPIWDNGTEQILPENTSTPTTSGILCDMTYRKGHYWEQNEALSILLGRRVEVDNPEEPLDIIMKGE